MSQLFEGISNMRLISLISVLFVAIAGLTAPAQAAKDPVYTGTFSSVAASGHDPVAYFTQGMPVEGSKEFESTWNDATWRFSSAENKAMFDAEPEKYAPQYGGYCAYAVSQGYTASTVPEAWSIVDGKLYLNYSLGVRKTWDQDRAGYIASANKNWPDVLN